MSKVESVLEGPKSGHVAEKVADIETKIEARGSKRQSEVEADDSIRYQEGYEREEFGPHGHQTPQTPPKMQVDAVTEDHPGPVGKFCKEELQWTNIGSGTFAKTFPQATWLRTTSKGGPPVQDVHRRIVRSLSTGRVVDDCIIDDVPDEKLNRKLHRPDDLRVELVMKDSLKMYEVKGPDVVEVFS